MNKKIKVFIGCFICAVSISACQKEDRKEITKVTEETITEAIIETTEETTVDSPVITEADKDSWKTITASEAKARMDSGNPLVILDVRTPQEYEENHIPGAVLLPNEEIKEKAAAVIPVTDAEILIYCRSGNRSAQAAETLTKLGYTNIYDFGGIQSWDYEVEAGNWEEKEGSFSSFYAATLDGRIVDEEIFSKANLTMLNIWATYCGPCLREMPDLGTLASEYEEGKLQIIGVVLDTMANANGAISMEAAEGARELVKQTEANYMHLLPSADLQKAGLLSVTGVPTTIFLDQEGNVIGEWYLGSRSKESWMKVINGIFADLEK